MVSEQAIVTTEWDNMAGEWDDLAVGYRNSLVKVLWDRTGITEKKNLVVVDFGCGTGLLTDYLRKHVKEVICIDPSPLMIQQLEDKLHGGQWSNVQAHCIALGDSISIARSKNSDQALRQLEGQVDLIIASSVFNFIPKNDLPETMERLGKLLRPNGGILCHSDWPEGDRHPDGFTTDRAKDIYEMAGLHAKSTEEIKMRVMASEESLIFVGVAQKP
mmetsp:Transcript_15533/g.21932  ORF Transcript_15533/g.21932 Transcript_15533/m.21932 type:complete len:217 (+) Transcript_15533:24-674(+)